MDAAGAVAGWWERLSASRSGRIWLAVVAAIAVVLIASGVSRLFEPRPEATLGPVGAGVDVELADIFAGESPEIDLTTLQRFESFRGIEPVSAQDYFGQPCLYLFDRSTSSSLLEGACIPAGSDLMVDVGIWPALDQSFAEGLPDGSIIRFQPRDDSVEVFVYRAPSNS